MLHPTHKSNLVLIIGNQSTPIFFFFRLPSSLCHAEILMPVYLFGKERERKRSCAWRHYESEGNKNRFIQKIVSSIPQVSSKLNRVISFKRHPIVHACNVWWKESVCKYTFEGTHSRHSLPLRLYKYSEQNAKFLQFYFVFHSENTENSLGRASAIYFLVLIFHLFFVFFWVSCVVRVSRPFISSLHALVFKLVIIKNTTPSSSFGLKNCENFSFELRWRKGKKKCFTRLFNALTCVLQVFFNVISFSFLETRKREKLFFCCFVSAKRKKAELC